jgi:hypothetical protein
VRSPAPQKSRSNEVASQRRIASRESHPSFVPDRPWATSRRAVANSSPIAVAIASSRCRFRVACWQIRAARRLEWPIHSISSRSWRLRWPASFSRYAAGRANAGRMSAVGPVAHRQPGQQIRRPDREAFGSSETLLPARTRQCWPLECREQRFAVTASAAAAETAAAADAVALRLPGRSGCGPVNSPLRGELMGRRSRVPRPGQSPSQTTGFSANDGARFSSAQVPR